MAAAHSECCMPGMARKTISALHFGIQILLGEVQRAISYLCLGLATSSMNSASDCPDSGFVAKEIALELSAIQSAPAAFSSASSTVVRNATTLAPASFPERMPTGT